MADDEQTTIQRQQPVVLFSDGDGAAASRVTGSSGGLPLNHLYQFLLYQQQ